MAQLWTITATATGDVLCPAYETPSTGSHPKDNGWAWDATTQTATRISARPDPNVQTFVGGAWIESAAQVEAMLIAAVKATNEANVRSIYSTNFGKQKKYSRKQQEVLDYRALSGSIAGLSAALSSTTLTVPLAGLTVTQQKKKFRFAMAQAQLRKVSLDVIIGEFETAIEANEAQVAAWEAVELEGIRAIKAATTAAAKRSAYAAINWNWLPA